MNINQLDLNKLYYFYVIAREGSIKKASLKLHLTQPTLSTQLKQLEDTLGYKLFLRKHRKLELNEMGKILLTKSESIFDMVQEIVSEKKSKKRDKTLIRIGITNTVSNSFVSNFSITLWKNPEYLIRLTQGTYSELEKRLERNQIDLIISEGIYKRKRSYTEVLLYSEPLIAVANPKLIDYKKSFPRSLGLMDYIGFNPLSAIHDEVEFYFQQNRVSPDLVGQANDLSLILHLTEKLACFSILPERAVKGALRRKSLIKLGTLKGIKHQSWAIIPKVSDKKKLIRQLIKDYFEKAHQ